MASNGTYQIRISAIDAASAKFDALNKKLAAIHAPVDRLNRNMAKFAKLSGLQGLSTGFRKFTGFVRSAGEAVSRVITPFAALTGAASLAGMYKLLTNFGEFSNKISIVATNLGLMPGQLQQLQGAARLAGSTGDAMANSLANLGDKMQDALAGRSAESLRMFQAWGINIRKGAGLAARSADEVMPELFEKLKKFNLDPRNSAASKRKALADFGIDPSMIIWINKGAAGWREYNEEAKKYVAVNKAGIAAASQMFLAQTKLTMAIESLGYAVAEKLSPFLTPLLDQLQQWIIAQRDLLRGTDITEYVKEFATWVKKAWGELKDFAIWLNSVANFFGGWKSAIEILIGLQVVGWMTNIAAGAITLAGTILGLTNAFKGLREAAALPPVPGAPEAIPGIGGPGIAGAATRFGFGGATGTFGGELGAVPEFIHGHPKLEKTLNSAADKGAGEIGDWFKSIFGFGKSGNDAEVNRNAPNGVPKTGPLFGEQRVAANTNVSPGMRGLLDTIADKESKGDYHKQYGGADIADLSHHPNQAITAGKYTSTAFGRYQFLNSTWEAEAKKLGLKDMSPANQDLAAKDLAETAYNQQTGRDLETDLKDPKRSDAVGAALNKIWPSLAGGSQSLTGSKDFADRLAAHSAEEAAQQGPQQAAQAPQAPASSTNTADVHVHLHGFPEGTQTVTSAKGDLFNGPPRVSQSMLSSAMI